MLRVGSRGYSQGAIRADANFEANLAGAQENGLQVGCYFFSQAVTAAEAEEEADFVLSVLNGRSMDLPVVFDWEQIVEEDARTDGMDKAAVTACAAAFCKAAAICAERSETLSCTAELSSALELSSPVLLFCR